MLGSTKDDRANSHPCTSPLCPPSAHSLLPLSNWFWNESTHKTLQWTGGQNPKMEIVFIFISFLHLNLLPGCGVVCGVCLCFCWGWGINWAGFGWGFILFWNNLSHKPCLSFYVCTSDFFQGFLLLLLISIFPPILTLALNYDHLKINYF